MLTGRLVKRVDEFAISTELIDVRNDRQIWGSQYTRKVSDMLAIQQQISSEISEKLHLSIKTIESHREHMKAKLGLARAAELVSYAFKWFHGEKAEPGPKRK